MRRCFHLAIFCISLLSHPLFGAPIQLLDGVPNSYVPGQPVAFDVRLPAITNLGSYNIDLFLQSTTGTAGVDFYFDADATVPSAVNYVFSSAANFVDAVNTDSTSRHRITLTDFDFGGANVVPGANDRVASVVFRTLPSFLGRVSLSVDVEGLILDTPDANPTPISDFETLKADVAAGGAIEISPVPEPSFSLLSGFGVIILLAWRGRAHSHPGQGVP